MVDFIVFGVAELLYTSNKKRKTQIESQSKKIHFKINCYTLDQKKQASLQSTGKFAETVILSAPRRENKDHKKKTSQTQNDLK